MIDQIDVASDDENEGALVTNSIITKTTTISPRKLALARTKHSHPKFASFVDQMCLSAGVLQPAADVSGVDGTIASLFEGNNGPLVLAAEPRRDVAMDANVQVGSDSESSYGSSDSDEDSHGSDSSAER